MTTTVAADLPRLPLREGITSFYVPTAELTYHVLSAGSPTNPLILLQHGFPELAFSWRKVMLPLAAAGFHVRLFRRKSFMFPFSDLQSDTRGRITPDLHEAPGADPGDSSRCREPFNVTPCPTSNLLSR